MTAASSLRDQRVARAIDREVAPIWHDRFARLIWRHLPSAPQLTLDVHSGPGRTTAELLQRLGPASRIVSLEPEEVMRTLAKARIPAQARNRVYLKAGDMSEVADMADATYDLVVANLVLSEALDLEEALRSLVRITKPGGQILATFPMAGTWQEAEDIFREVLRDGGLSGAERRLGRLGNLRPSGTSVARIVEALGVGADHFIIEQERFCLLFRSGREFLFAPLVEHGPLRLWKAILGDHDKPQEVFWQLKEYLDAYYAGHAFGITICAGLLCLRVPQLGSTRAHASAQMTGDYWRRFPELDALWQRQERAELDDASSPEDIDIDLEDIEADIEVETDAADDVKEPSLAEDEAIFAALEPSTVKPPDAALDALLDQVLEFVGPARDSVEELDDELVEEVEPEDVHRPGDTLKRIRALMPPHPDIVPKPPPLPGRKRGR